MAHLAHEDRGFFMSLIILVPPKAILMEHTVDWFWNHGGTVFLVKEPHEGAMLAKVGSA